MKVEFETLKKVSDASQWISDLTPNELVISKKDQFMFNYTTKYLSLLNDLINSGLIILGSAVRDIISIFIRERNIDFSYKLNLDIELFLQLSFSMTPRPKILYLDNIDVNYTDNLLIILKRIKNWNVCCIYGNKLDQLGNECRSFIMTNKHDPDIQIRVDSCYKNANTIASDFDVNSLAYSNAKGCYVFSNHELNKKYTVFGILSNIKKRKSEQIRSDLNADRYLKLLKHDYGIWFHLPSIVSRRKDLEYIPIQCSICKEKFSIDYRSHFESWLDKTLYSKSVIEMNSCQHVMHFKCYMESCYDKSCCHACDSTKLFIETVLKPMGITDLNGIYRYFPDYLLPLRLAKY